MQMDTYNFLINTYRYKYKLFLDDYLDAFQIQKKSVKTVNWITTFELNNSKYIFKKSNVLLTK